MHPLGRAISVWVVVMTLSLLAVACTGATEPAAQSAPDGAAGAPGVGAAAGAPEAGGDQSENGATADAGAEGDGQGPGAAAGSGGGGAGQAAPGSSAASAPAAAGSGVPAAAAGNGAPAPAPAAPSPGTDAGGSGAGGTGGAGAESGAAAAPPEPGPERLNLVTWDPAAVGRSAPEQQGIVVFGRVSDEGGSPVRAGVVLLEQGAPGSGRWQAAGAIYPNGGYAVALPATGEWGIHFLADGFYHQAVPVQVTEQTDLEVNIALAWQGPDVPLPIIGTPVLELLPDGRLRVSMPASDPRDDLSALVMAANISTGQVVQLEPPSPPTAGVAGVRPPQYPGGNYSRTIEPAGGGEGLWLFAAVSHRGGTSPLIRLATAFR